MQIIYLDNASTTQVDSDVAAAALDMMINRFGNPSSLHELGMDAQLRMTHAERQILAALKTKNGRVMFTSGGTESNNLALFGAARAMQRRGRHIVTTALEHPSVAAVCSELVQQGFDVTIVPPNQSGNVDAEALLGACCEDTILVSAMSVNHETGAVLPIKEAFNLIRRQKPQILLHTDAVQAFGKIELFAKDIKADLISISGHKIHAPKGIGALYCSSKCRILPLFFGGGQQGGIRPGTENTSLAFAFGLAAEKSCASRMQNLERMRTLHIELIARLQFMQGVVINSPLENCSPYIVNFSIPGYRSETLLHFLENFNIYVSSGSACSKGAKSHILKVLGCHDAVVDSALRISLCRYSTPEDLNALFDALTAAVSSLRST